MSIIFYTVTLVLVLILSIRIIKRTIFRTIAITLFLLSFVSCYTLSERYNPPLSVNKAGFNYPYLELLDSKSQIIDTVIKYPILTIQNAQVPKRILATSSLLGSCAKNDTIVEMRVIGRMKRSSVWFYKKANETPENGFLLF